jgi:hypothetical protein
VTETSDIPARQAAIKALDTLDQRMIDAEYKSAQPKPHTFMLTPEGQ